MTSQHHLTDPAPLHAMMVCLSVDVEQDRPVKRHGCGREYSQAEWEQLPFAYREHFDADEFGPDETTEFRHCKCGSTIGIKVH